MNLINMPRAAWKRQPQGAAQVRAEYSADKMFVFCPSISRTSDIELRYRGFLNNSSVSQSFDDQGACFRQVGGSGSFITNQSIFSSTGISILSSFYLDNYAGSAYNYFLNCGWAFAARHGSVSNNFAFYDGSTVHNMGFSLSPGKRYNVLICLFGNKVSIFVNGEVKANTTIAYANSFGGQLLRIGNFSTTSNGLGDASYSLTAISNRDLSGAGIELTRNPWQIFAAAPPRSYFIPAAPTLTIPTLSAPGVTDITATSARPQVTLTY